MFLPTWGGVSGVGSFLEKGCGVGFVLSVLAAEFPDVEVTARKYSAKDSLKLAGVFSAQS